MKKIVLVLILFLFPPTLSWADEYVLVMSKEDNVCQHMHKLYNEDLRKYGEIKYDEHEEFKAIKWEEKKYYWHGVIDNIEKRGTVLLSKFDINNDGKDEIIIKDEHEGVRGIDSDRLYIFREKDYDFSQDEITLGKAFADKAIGAWGYVFNRKPFEGNVYSLYELPPYKIWIDPTSANKNFKFYYALGGWFYFHPFFYKGKYFTSMNDRLPGTAERWRLDPAYEENKWEVILQFTPENQLKDTCYFLKVSDCKK